MNSKTAALIIGFTFIAVGVIGFTGNPLVGNNAIFHTDVIHNLVHVISGVLFVLVALASPGNIRGFMKLFGIIYFLLGVIGFMVIGSEGMTVLLGFLHINGPDNYLHVALGVVIFLAGMYTRNTTTVSKSY